MLFELNEEKNFTRFITSISLIRPFHVLIDVFVIYTLIPSSHLPLVYILLRKEDIINHQSFFTIHIELNSFYFYWVNPSDDGYSMLVDWSVIVDGRLFFLRNYLFTFLSFYFFFVFVSIYDSIWFDSKLHRQMVNKTTKPSSSGVSI